MPLTRLARATATNGKATAAVSHVRIAERAARGKPARSEVPCSSHAAYDPAADRADRIELLERQAATRVPEQVPIRSARTLVPPFTFGRGEARLMADDLPATPPSWLQVQCCGEDARTRAPATSW
jgi:Uncharacterized protein conserved in bacteria (DUF2252)